MKKITLPKKYNPASTTQTQQRPQYSLILSLLKHVAYFNLIKKTCKHCSLARLEAKTE